MNSRWFLSSETVSVSIISISTVRSLKKEKENVFWLRTNYNQAGSFQILFWYLLSTEPFKHVIKYSDLKTNIRSLLNLLLDKFSSHLVMWVILWTSRLKNFQDTILRNAKIMEIDGIFWKIPNLTWIISNTFFKTMISTHKRKE